MIKISSKNINQILSVIGITLITTNVYGAVATVDVGSAGTYATKEMSADASTMGAYVSSVATTMNKIQNSMSAVEQLKNLQGLQKLQAGDSLCRLCDVSDYQQLQDYRQSVNDDLCSQFSTAYKNLTGVTNAAKSLQDISTLLTTDPKAAALSLQQASISAAQTTNSTLAQIQMMQAQQMQKQLAAEKNSKVIQQSTNHLDMGL